MKLLDFTNTIEVQMLLENMGITTIKIAELPEVKFTRVVEKTVLVTPSEVIEFAEKIKRTAIPLHEINKNFKLSTTNDFIEINGQKMCAYIKAQSSAYGGSSSYRYHLCNCKTIKSMITEGRGDRYVVTAREDGKFPVLTYDDRIERLTELGLCQNCIEILKAKGMYFQPFNLAEFYRRYQPDVRQTFKREELVRHKEEYAPNHDEVARAYRKKVENKCPACKVDCSSNPSLLELHHKNGNKNDNSPKNLEMICTSCHSIKYKHEHMKRSPHQVKKIKEINDLKEFQGIPYLP